MKNQEVSQLKFKITKTGCSLWNIQGIIIDEVLGLILKHKLALIRFCCFEKTGYRYYLKGDTAQIGLFLKDFKLLR